MKQHYFKGYSHTQKRILLPHELAMSGVYVGMDARLTCREDITLLPFTGRQDINGRPIFETDVVDFDMVIPITDDKGFATAQRRRGVVKWIDPPGWYGIEVPGETEENEYVEWDAQNAMLVGNALATPELLKLPPIYGNPMERASQSSKT